MYATYTRRQQPDSDRRTPERARKGEGADRTTGPLRVEEHFTKLRQAPGFVSVTIIRGEDREDLAVTLWERHEDAAAFQPETQRWAQTLDQVLPLIAQGQGEVFTHLTPRTDGQG